LKGTQANFVVVVSLHSIAFSVEEYWFWRACYGGFSEQIKGVSLCHV